MTIPTDPTSGGPVARFLSRIRAHPALRRFTLLNRILLATAFLPTGLVKLVGRRFTEIPIEHPVGFFFEAMYRTGPWWYLIGALQVVAAICLLIPATATLGALLFLPIAISILAITIGVGFGNTMLITSGMVLAVVWLIVWDADRILDAAKRVTGRDPNSAPLAGAHLIERVGWVLGGTALMAFFLVTRSFLPGAVAFPAVVVGGVGGISVLTGWALGRSRDRVIR